jgi:hypothetical protein
MITPESGMFRQGFLYPTVERLEWFDVRFGGLGGTTSFDGAAAVGSVGFAGKLTLKQDPESS